MSLASLMKSVTSAFAARYPGAAPRLFRAPGRVNLIGEHTDYNGGFVLPAAIDRQVVVAARLRSDPTVRAAALDFAQETTFTLEHIQQDPTAPWSAYIRGVAWALQQEGHRLRGMDAVIAGDVPIGSGLSSSAALEVASGYALLRLAGEELDRKELAVACQRAENEFVGMRCGIMDQFIACLGEESHALLIDCRDLTHRLVPVPSGVAIIVVDSGVRRGLRDSEYNTRRAECETAARHFGVETLREVSEEQFRARAKELPELVRRRARHVITENARTLTAAEALAAGDLPALGRLMYASHASLRDDFEVSVPEIDKLVEIARQVDEVYGARITGGGFGGCIVAMAAAVATEAVEAAIGREYPPATGRQAAVYVCQASAGVSEL